MAGQVIKRGDRKYLVRVYLGVDADGKRKYHNKTINGTKKDAEVYKNKILHQVDTGSFHELSQDYFQDYISNWLETVVKNRVTEKTYRGYEQSTRLYLIPVLGKTSLDRITPDQVQSLYHEMTENGLSSATVKNAHAVLNSAMKQAVKWGKIVRNPAELVDLPRKKRSEMKVLNVDQAKKFLEAAVYSRMKSLFTLLITTGMRPGEALGLKWSDIDFDKNRITISKSLSRVSGKWSLKEPKTNSGRRTVPVPKEVIKDLIEHKEIQDDEKLKQYAHGYTDHNFVYATSSGEPFNDRNVISQYFKPLLKDAGLPDIRLYDLRHTCATLLLAAGENPKIVSERLGHADISLTLNTYSHVLPDMQESAAKKMEDMLF